MRRRLTFLTLLFFCSMLFSTCLKEDRFEKISSEKGNEIEFKYYGEAFEKAEKEGFLIKKNSDDYQLFRNNSKSRPFNYPIFIMDLTENYMAIRTGISTIDAGWKYYFVPTYSKIIILDKEDLDVIFNKTVSDRVDMISIQNDYIYFSYGTHPNLDYARFPFSE